MICTVTLNPSLDHIVRVDAMRVGRINRASYEQLAPGGKGVNVSLVLGNLGHASLATGFVAGFTGADLVRMLTARGVTCDFVRVGRGLTRINTKVEAAEETELNGPGPEAGPKDLELLLAKLDGLGAKDTLVLSGSVPSSLGPDVYGHMLERVAPRGVRVLVATERELLPSSLPSRPFLVKPNNVELGTIFGVELHRRDEAVPFARRLQEMGARNVMVSMAGEGGVLVTEGGEVFEGPAARGVVVNSVGAGDSAVAGFLAGVEEGRSMEGSFRMALACGSASAFSDHLATRAEMEALL